MDPYDQRRITLDPGLTALALRALHERDGHYPFVERRARRRRAAARARRLAGVLLTQARALMHPGHLGKRLIAFTVGWTIFMWAGVVLAGLRRLP